MCVCMHVWVYVWMYAGVCQCMHVLNVTYVQGGGGGMSVEEARVGERGRECKSKTKIILYIFYIYIFF